MAEITSYPTASPKGGDYLLGAQVGQPGDNPANPTKKFTVGSVLALGTTPLVQHVQKVITSAELLSFNTYPTEIKLIEAPGPNKAIVALNAAFKLDFTIGPVYDFNQDLRFAYIDPTGVAFAGEIPFELLNSGPNDQYATEDLPGQPGSPFNPIKVNSAFGIANNPGTTVTQGTGELVIDLLYRTVEFPS
jgi:hypothetical protein